MTSPERGRNCYFQNRKVRKRKKHHPPSILHDKKSRTCYLCIMLHDNWSEHSTLGRGVTSLTTLTGKQSPWKKIRVVETMDMINNDIVELAEDNYIGKYQNTYSNKCLLLSAIKTYMDEILVNGLIEDYSIEFDVEKIRKYVIENEKIKKEDAEAMSDEEMQKQYTDEKVYFKATVTISDVMEDIYLDITA